MLVQSHLNNLPSNRWLHPWHTCEVRKLRIRGLGSFRQRAQQNPSLTCFFTPPLLLHHLLFCSVLLNTCQEQSWSNQHLAMVAWRVLNAIFWINLYLVGIIVHFVNSYRLIYPLKTRVISPFKRRVCHTPTLLPPTKKKNCSVTSKIDSQIRVIRGSHLPRGYFVLHLPQMVHTFSFTQSKLSLIQCS